MDYVASLDSSRDLRPIHVKNFINRLHLILYTCIEIFDSTFFFCGVYGCLKKLRQMWLVALVRAHFHWQKQPLPGKERKKTQLESG